MTDLRRRPDGAPGLLVRPHPELELVSLGFQVAHWAETFLCHGPGDVEGEPLEIDDELLGFIACCYAQHPDHGRRLVHEAVLSRLKGRAKSEIAGIFAVVEALAPVRFDHWAVKGETSWWGYGYEVGEPAGRPVRSPFVRILATEEGQTSNTYENVVLMLQHAAEHWPDHFGGVDVGRSVQSSTRINLPGSGKIEPCTAGSASKDGGKESFAVGDEPHLYISPELRRMYSTVSRNLTKRKAADPWMLLTSTWFYPGEDSVAEARYQQATGIADGKTRNTGLLYDHRHGLIPDDWDDDEAMLAGLVEAAGGAAGWMNLERTLEEIRKPDTTVEDAKRYFFNTLDGTAEDICAVEAWRVLERSVRLHDGDTITVGFDGSDSDDATALWACRWPDFSLFRLGVWERPAKAPSWKVPRLDVHAAVEETFKRYRVVRGYFDPPKWRTDIDTWAMEYGEEVVLEWPTFSDARMVPAADRFVALIDDQMLGHDADPVLARHIAAAKRQKARGGWRPVKKDRRKIDALVAAMLAVHALGDAVAAGLTVDDDSVYEGRDMVVVG